MAAAAAVSATGQIQSGLYAAQVAKNQAIVAGYNRGLSHDAAADTLAQGQEQQQKLGRDIAQKVGAQEARMGANNVDLTFGSAARVIGDTKLIGAEDQKALNENVNRQVYSRQIDAWNFTTQVSADRAEASQAPVAAAFGAASTILGAATQYSKYKTSMR